MGDEICHCLYDQHIQLVKCIAKLLTLDMHSVRGSALLTPQVHFINKVKLTPGWVLISIEEIRLKVWVGRSLVRLLYIYTSLMNRKTIMCFGHLSLLLLFSGFPSISGFI